VSFDKMMDFLSNVENRQTVEMMVNLAKKLAKS